LARYRFGAPDAAGRRRGFFGQVDHNMSTGHRPAFGSWETVSLGYAF
jgi:hypothetical protein